MKNKRMNLRLFDGESDTSKAGAGNGDQKNTGATYSYEQAEEIANARAEKAQRAALADFFRKQGMSEEQITSAIADYKEKQKANQPDVATVEKERDNYKKQLEKMQNEKMLTDKGVKSEDIDYVMFKATQLVDDKTDFEKAAEKFLKDNPRYAGKAAYRVSMSASTGTETNGSGGNMNSTINDAIRAAIKK